MKDTSREAGAIEGLAAKHPEFKPLAGRLIGLYGEITAKGLENEQTKG